MMKILIITILITLLNFAQEEEGITIWSPLQLLIGTWEGTGEGKFGNSTIEREYKFIMGGTFILGTNTSIYEEQEKNPDGEIHDHWDIFSYDKRESKYMFRQFHAEDIVNTFSLDSLKASKGELEFITESIENFGEEWRAKEVYKFKSDNEFMEIFYLAPPGKEFTEYIRNTFKRKNED